MTTNIHPSSKENNSLFVYTLCNDNLTKHNDKEFLMFEYIFMSSHEKRYVALSRRISWKTTKVWIKHIGDK